MLLDENKKSVSTQSIGDLNETSLNQNRDHHSKCIEFAEEFKKISEKFFLNFDRLGTNIYKSLP